MRGSKLQARPPLLPACPSASPYLISLLYPAGSEAHTQPAPAQKEGPPCPTNPPLPIRSCSSPGKGWICRDRPPTEAARHLPQAVARAQHPAARHLFLHRRRQAGGGRFPAPRAAFPAREGRCASDLLHMPRLLWPDGKCAGRHGRRHAGYHRGTGQSWQGRHAVDQTGGKKKSTGASGSSGFWGRLMEEER